VLSTTDAAAQKLSKAERAAIAMSPDAASYSVKVTGEDQLDPAIYISTSPFHSEGYGVADHFLRAIIDKKTGRTAYQVYVITRDREAQRYSSVTYESTVGPADAKVDILDTDVDCGRYSCYYSEQVVFELPKQFVASVAATAKAGDGATWRYKLHGRTAGGGSMTMLKTEFAAILLATARLRRQLELPADPSG
jgi:hypothetical protein